jgi:hypothetical protein
MACMNITKREREREAHACMDVFMLAYMNATAHDINEHPEAHEYRIHVCMYAYMYVCMHR